MKIICFTDSLGAGGAQRQIVGLASLLLQNGDDVKVCYYRDVPFYSKYLDEKGVPHKLIPKASGHVLRIPSVINYFRSENPDWVIAYQETPSIVATIAKIVLGNFRLIASERSTTQRIGISERIRFFLYKWVDYIVPNSYTQAGIISSLFPGLSSKIHVISNYVDLDLFASPRARSRHQIPEVMIAASIWPLKNTLGLIEAIALLKKKGLSFHASWYGKDENSLDYYNKCNATIKLYEVEDSIILLDKRKDIQVLYQNADYFCLPSFYEGMPNVICEAMACGLPIVCSDVCDNGRYVVNGENGFLFNPNVVKDIALALERALSLNETEYQAYCRNSRNRAESLLTKDSFIQAYLELLRKHVV